MKIKLFFTVMILFFVSIVLKAKDRTGTKLDCMQGIWQSIIDDNQSEQGFSIINGFNALNFVYINDDKLNFPLIESLKGFQNNKFENSDSINIDSLKENALYYTIIFKDDIQKNGWVLKPSYLTPDYFACDDEMMSIGGAQLSEYERIKKLPNDALYKLYYRGIQDDRNYIKEYLDITVAEVINNSTVYSEHDVSSNVLVELKKGSVITILEENKNWLKVDYGTETLGWIKKSDVKENSITPTF